MEDATEAPACGPETTLVDWETWDAVKVERMGRAFQKNVRHLCSRSPLDPPAGLHSHTHLSETAHERRVRRRGARPALRRGRARARRAQPPPRCAAARARAPQQNAGGRDAGRAVRRRRPDCGREREAAEQEADPGQGLVERRVAVAQGGRLRAAEPGQGRAGRGRRAGNVAGFIWVSGYIRYESVPGPTATRNRSPDPGAKLRVK